MGAEDGPQPLRGVGDQSEELGIEVPEHRAAQRLDRFRVRIGRSGPEQ
jgi:hypothetical protein